MKPTNILSVYSQLLELFGCLWLTLWGETLWLSGRSSRRWHWRSLVQANLCAGFSKISLVFTQQEMGSGLSSDQGKVKTVIKRCNTPPQLHHYRYKLTISHILTRPMAKRQPLPPWGGRDGMMLNSFLFRYRLGAVHSAHAYVARVSIRWWGSS